jgi:peroxiredoxin-like protein
MTDHHYYAHASWTEGRKGTVAAQGIAQSLSFSAPPEFMGESGLWTPEHFLAAALASCFVTTFKAIAEFSKFEFLALKAEVEAVLEKEQAGYRFSRIILRPVLEIAAAAERDRALRLLEKAEHGCLISRSLNGAMELHPEVLVQPAEHVETTK